MRASISAGVGRAMGLADGWSDGADMPEQGWWGPAGDVGVDGRAEAGRASPRAPLGAPASVLHSDLLAAAARGTPATRCNFSHSAREPCFSCRPSFTTVHVAHAAAASGIAGVLQTSSHAMAAVEITRKTSSTADGSAAFRRGADLLRLCPRLCAVC